MKRLRLHGHKQIWLLTALALILSCASKQQGSERTGNYETKVHRYASPAGGIFSNAYYIELEHNVVVVDATLTNTTSRTLKSKIDSIGKPIAAILLTHGHPDHYNGLGNLAQAAEIPIYCTQEVLDVIEEYDADKEKQWTPMFGAEWPTNRIFPNTIVKDGQVLNIDGARFSVHTLGPGESHADSYWVMEDNNRRHAFIGDAVLNGVHAYMSDGHFVEWMENLSALEESLKNVQLIYPGHGDPGSGEMLTWQKEYIRDYVLNVEAILGKNEKLDEAAKQELVARMKKMLPNDRLEFLIPLGADVVADRIIELKRKGEFGRVMEF